MLGLTTKAWDVLDELCTIEYMGAAEYEFGKLPKFLGGFLDVAEEKGLSTFSFVLGPNERELSFNRKHHNSSAPLPPAQDVRLYGICVTDQVDLIVDRIRELAKDSCRVKRGSGLSNALDPYDNDNPVTGWVELSNGFLFFSDETMWRGFSDLFSVDTCEVPKTVAVTVDYTKMLKPDLVKAAVKLGMFRTKTAANKVGKAVLLSQLTQ